MEKYQLLDLKLLLLIKGQNNNNFIYYLNLILIMMNLIVLEDKVEKVVDGWKKINLLQVVKHSIPGLNQLIKHQLNIVDNIVLLILENDTFIYR